MRSLFNYSRSCIKLNDLPSPMLFNLFLNDLAKGVINKQSGVKAGVDKLSTLLYANGFQFISDTPDKP